MKLRSLVSLIVGLSLSLMPITGKPVTTSEVNAAGSKCRMPTFQEAYRESKAVFVGEVTHISTGERSKYFYFKVEKYWKGIKDKRVKLTTSVSSRYQASYQVGRKYLIFARADDKGELIDTRCSRSNTVEMAGVDIKALGKSKKP